MVQAGSSMHACDSAKDGRAAKSHDDGCYKPVAAMLRTWLGYMLGIYGVERPVGQCCASADEHHERYACGLDGGMRVG